MQAISYHGRDSEVAFIRAFLSEKQCLPVKHLHMR